MRADSASRVSISIIELGLNDLSQLALAEINQCDAYRKAIDEIKNLFDYTRTGLNNDFDHRHVVTNSVPPSLAH